VFKAKTCSRNICGLVYMIMTEAAVVVFDFAFKFYCWYIIAVLIISVALDKVLFRIS